MNRCYLKTHATFFIASGMSVGRFDRSLAFRVARIPPQVSRAGECVDQLIGPWLESVGTNLLRMSPLASNFGRKTLDDDEQRRIHEVIAVHMLRAGTVSAVDTNAIMFHALAGESTSSLERLAHAVWRAGGPILETLAQELLLLRLMPTSGPIYGRNPVASILLRIAQFKLVSTLGDTSKTRAVAAVLIEESETLLQVEHGRRLQALVLMSVLGAMGVANFLDDWVKVLLQLRSIVEEDTVLQEVFSDMRRSMDSEHANVFSGLFSIGTARLESVERLEQVVGELDKVDADTRALLLAPVDEASSDYSLFINGPWVQHENSETFDAEDAAERYTKMAAITERWGVPELPMQCSVAHGVILDEFQHRPDEALVVLKDAIATLGEHVILLRALAKVHLRRGAFEEALDIFESIADGVGGKNPVERAFALRDAAIASARKGKWAQAEAWFVAAQKAAARAQLKDMDAMAVGLGGDAAWAALQGGESGRGTSSPWVCCR